MPIRNAVHPLVPAVVEAAENRPHYCAVLDRGVLGAECQELCRNEINNYGICTPANYSAPWRICIACVMQQGAVPSSLVVDRKGYCAFHGRYGADALRVDVYDPPIQVWHRTGLDTTAEKLLDCAIRYKVKREGLSLSQLIEETGLPVAAACWPYPRARKWLQRMRGRGVPNPVPGDLVRELEVYSVQEPPTDPVRKAVAALIQEPFALDGVHHDEENTTSSAPVPNGRNDGMRPRISTEKVKQLKELISSGMPKKKVAKQLGISYATVRKYAGSGHPKKSKSPKKKRTETASRPKKDPSGRGQPSRLGSSDRAAALELAWRKVEEGLEEIRMIRAAADDEARRGEEFQKRALAQIGKLDSRK